MEMLLDMRRTRGQLGFLCMTVLVTVLFTALGYVTMVTLGKNHHFSSLAIFFCILYAIFWLGMFIALCIQRLNDARWPGILALLTLVPAVNLGLWILLLVLPSRKT